ncbi:MAG TPA: hypothetical protein VE007_07125 [Thermoanaerobaculia bacterium]|nr:hypothetical protein [Thermoanaerobaculia bacterium]
MNKSWILRFVLPAALLAAVVAGCKDSDTTTAPGSVATVSIDAPQSARSGETFTIDVSAVAVGINNVHNGRVEVTLPAPLQVVSADASPGTSAAFSNSAAGATVSWLLNTLDSNSQSRLHIQTMGVLPPGSAAQTLTVRASLTGDGIRTGDAVANDSLQLMP